MPAQQQQGGGGGQQNDSGMGPVWITVLAFFTLYLIWREAHHLIVSVVFSINILEAKLVNYFLSSKTLAQEIYIMQTVDPKAVSWGDMVSLTRVVSSYIRYPVLICLVLLAIVLYKSNITFKFRHKHSMKSLRSQEVHNWPAIEPICKLDLINTDVSQGPWAMALSPMEFAKKYQLIRKSDAILDKNSPGLEKTASIKRADAKRVFTLQLGPYWDGFNKCPPYVRALAAIFIARIHRDRTSATQILINLDKSSVSGKLDYSLVNNIIRKYQHTELVQEVVQRHAYLLTFMASLLHAARDDGVVSVSEFLWLKVVDRRLWYMLSCVGRQTPFVEVAGPFAQWKAEKAMGRPMQVPMIDEAIKALEMAVKEVKLSPKELQELAP